MLEYLRKEVFKLRGQNAQLRADFDLLKENNQKLMEANASAGSAFSALNQHAKQLGATNAKLLSELDKYKKAAHRLNHAQLEAKEALQIKSASYDAEVQAHLQHQNNTNDIVGMVQERCKDVRLVQDVLALHGSCALVNVGVTKSESSLGAPSPQRPSKLPPTPDSMAGSTTSNNSKGSSRMFGLKSKSKAGKKK